MWWKLERVVDSIIHSSDDYVRCLNGAETQQRFIEHFTSQLARHTQLEHSKNLESLQNKLEDMRQPFLHCTEFLSRRESYKLLESMSSVPYKTHLAQAKKHLLQGTGHWLQSSKEFMKWQNSSRSQMLWLHGPPGSGKSTLLYAHCDLVTQILADHVGRTWCLPPLPQVASAILCFQCISSVQEVRRKPPEATPMP